MQSAESGSAFVLFIGSNWLTVSFSQSSEAINNFFTKAFFKIFFSPKCQRICVETVWQFSSSGQFSSSSSSTVSHVPWASVGRLWDKEWKGKRKVRNHLFKPTAGSRDAWNACTWPPATAAGGVLYVLCPICQPYAYVSDSLPCLKAVSSCLHSDDQTEPSCKSNYFPFQTSTKAPDWRKYYGVIEWAEFWWGHLNAQILPNEELHTCN